MGRRGGGKQQKQMKMKKKKQWVVVVESFNSIDCVKTSVIIIHRVHIPTSTPTATGLRLERERS